MRALPSSLVVNVDVATALELTLADRRELAFVRFVSSAVACATQREGGVLPAYPVDMKYVLEASRYLYERREMLIRLLTEDPENFLWGE